ncbi:MAG: Starch-binding associating with outer rane [Mucilaginibacter sp.]|nr:Starch-binding associating with outer rane [Mucilaginibacter sp.]
MKKIITLVTAVIMLSACNKLNVPPVSIIQDQQVFTSVAGIQAYFAGLYNRLPIEDTKFSNGSGYNQFSYIDNINTFTGEETNKNSGGFATMNLTSDEGGFNFYYNSYFTIRQANYFIQTMPQYTANFTTAQVNNWIGEAYFIRAFTYFEMVKRFGGVPIITTVQNYPQQTLDQLQVPRNSEEEVYNQIGADLDKSYSLMGATSENRGRANKYIAAALKSRAMLFAGSIAKYNVKNYNDPATGKRVEGIPAADAVTFFKASYAASVLVQAGGYTLYRATPNDKVGNYVNLFFDVTPANKEVLWTKEYSNGNAGSSYDVFAVPHQEQSSIGYTSYNDPTEDLVELFDGLPKNADGSLKTTDTNGKYIYYGITPTTTQTPYSTLSTVNTASPIGPNIVLDSTVPTSNNVISNEFGIFQNAEPRLLASVIVPGSIFKGEIIDLRRGIYTGSITNGIPAFNAASLTPYTGNSNIAASTASDGTPNINISNPAINVPAGTNLLSGGLSGIYGSRNGGTISGYLVRKYSDQTKPTTAVVAAGSYQPWLEIRYAEVELNRAEADWELNSLGQSDVNYMQDAYTMINDIRDRAGATLLTSAADLADVNVIRRERRKELCFENKIYWDLIRWRTFDTEVNNRVWLVLNPIYVAANGKYIYDRRPYEGNSKFTFPVMQYYQQFPSAELITNPKLVQNQ